MLCLQTKTIAMAINLATLAGDRSVQKIAGVKLNAGLGGEYFHDSTGARFEHARGQGEVCAAVVEHPVVVVAQTEP